MRRVAYLDDNELLRSIMRQLLETALGVTCVCARNLEDLKTLVKDSPPISLTILDINLGDKEATGVDAYHWLREEGHLFPIIFLTGYKISDPLVRLAELTGAPILEKPIRAPVFIEYLRCLLSLREDAEIEKRV